MSVDSADATHLGARLGPCEIVTPLGAGGIGEVFRARDTRPGRDVAVKVCRSTCRRTPEVQARFEREAKTLLAQPSEPLHAGRRRT